MRWMNAQPENQDGNGGYAYVKYPKQSGEEVEARLYSWIARKSRLTADRLAVLTGRLGNDWQARCFPKTNVTPKTTRTVAGLMEWMNAQPENRGGAYVRYPAKHSEDREERLWYDWLQRLRSKNRHQVLQALAENLGHDWAARCFPDPWLDGFRLVEDHWRRHRAYPTRSNDRKLYDWLRNSRRGGVSHTVERWNRLSRLFGVEDWEEEAFPRR